MLAILIISDLFPPLKHARVSPIRKQQQQQNNNTSLTSFSSLPLLFLAKLLERVLYTHGLYFLPQYLTEISCPQPQSSENCLGKGPDDSVFAFLTSFAASEVDDHSFWNLPIS